MAQVGVVAIGQLANSLILALVTVVALLLSIALDSLPHVFSKFAICFGLATLLDPYLVFLVDLFHLNFDCVNRTDSCRVDYTASDCKCVTGDAFKLWARMARTEASGVTGAFYTILIYAFTTLLAGLILYHYILYAHMNGRLMDNFKRINEPEENFFIPDDNEISMESLRNILSKAKRWRGPGGTLRKVHVSKFTVTDKDDSAFSQVMTHVAIFTTDVDLSRSLFRHFLVQHNGCVAEIDDEIMQHFSGRMSMEKLMGEIDATTNTNAFADGTEQGGIIIDNQRDDMHQG